jgi:nitrile hydratase
MGGLPAGPVDTSHHGEAAWHRMATALNMALGPSKRGLMRVDERRRATEDLADYAELGYFDRSVQAGANLLIEKGVLTRDEIDRRMAEIRARRGKGA